MINYLTLLKSDFLNTYSFINKANSLWKRILAIISFLLIIVAMVFIGFFSASLAPSLQQYEVLGDVFSSLAVVTLFFSFFSATRMMTTSLMDSNDYELLSSLPISEKTLLLMKITRTYIDANIIPFILVFPIIIGVGIGGNMGALYYIFTLIAFALVPVPAMVIAAILSILLLNILSRFNFLKKLLNIIPLIIYLIIFIPYFSFSFSFNQSSASQNLTAADIANIFSTNKSAFSFFKLYPFSELVKEITVNQNILSLIIFIAISLVILALFIVIFGKSYKNINRSVREHTKKKNYSLKIKKQSSVLSSLIKKDIINFSSYSFVIIQSALGGILACALAFVMFRPAGFFDLIKKELPSHYIALIAVAICQYIATLTTYTSFGISIEGANFWVLKSLPIKSTDVFKSKICINLLVNAPFIVIALSIIQYNLRLNLIFLTLLSILYCTQIILASIYAQYFNLIFPKMDWDNINKAVKNSVALIISLITSLLLVLLLVVVAVTLSLALPDIFTFVPLCLALISIQMIFVAIFSLLLLKHGTKLFREIPA